MAGDVWDVKLLNVWGEVDSCEYIICSFFTFNSEVTNGFVYPPRVRGNAAGNTDLMSCLGTYKVIYLLL